MFCAVSKSGLSYPTGGKTIRLLIIQTCLILTLSALAQADFKDDFDGKLNPLWKPVSGIWELQDGTYNGRGIGQLPGFSLLPFEAADGLVIEVRAMDTAKGVFQNALIVFAYVDESEIYFAGSAIQRGRMAGSGEKEDDCEEIASRGHCPPHSD